MEVTLVYNIICFVFITFYFYFFNSIHHIVPFLISPLLIGLLGGRVMYLSFPFQLKSLRSECILNILNNLHALYIEFIDVEKGETLQSFFFNSKNCLLSFMLVV